MKINKFQDGGVPTMQQMRDYKPSVYEQMRDSWQQSYTDYLNGIGKPELPAGAYYDENGVVSMHPEEVLNKGYKFIRDTSGKVLMVDKDYNVLMSDVKNQKNLDSWIRKHNLYVKPKSLSEASQLASLRNHEGMQTIRDAFQWGGNWAGGTIAAPVLAVGASEFAPYLYSKAPQVVDKAMRIMNPGSLGEMVLGKDAATQAIRTGLLTTEKFPWLMANTNVGAAANAIWMSAGATAALNNAWRAFSGETTDSKTGAALNAVFSLPFVPVKGVENAEMLLKLPFLRNSKGNLNQFGLFLNRGLWKQGKTLWRQFHKKSDAPYDAFDIGMYVANRNADVAKQLRKLRESLIHETQKLNIQFRDNSRNLSNMDDLSNLLYPRVKFIGDKANLDNFVYDYYVIHPSARKQVDDLFTGVTTHLRIPENSPKYQALNYNTVELTHNIPIQTPSTPEEIANFRAYRQSINDLLREDGLVAGSTVGYSRGYIQGGMNNDTEIITTRSRLADAQKKMKFTKVGENSIGGDVGTSPLAKGKTPQVEYDIIDEDATGNATGTLAHQIFQALHPEEARQFYKSNIDNDTASYTLSLPIKAEQLLQELRQEGNMEKVQMIDMFGAGINARNKEALQKHATRAYNVLLNPEFVPDVRSTLDLMLHKQFGPKVENFSSKISDFTNVEYNKRFLNEIINANELKYFSPEQVEEIARNPEQMRNIFDYYNMNNFIGNRGMNRWSPLVERDMTPSELREGFYSNIQYGGGSGSGVGLNNTSGAFKAGDGFGSINGTRLTQTTYDPNPQSIPDWIAQFRRITDESNFPSTLYNQIGKPNEIARIEAESRKLNLPVWRSMTTEKGQGAYLGSYTGPLYYETNPNNVFILHGVFPENGGLFTSKFQSYFNKPRLVQNSTHDNLVSYESQHPFEFLRSKGYEIRNHTTPEDKELNSIARRYPLNKVLDHLNKRRRELQEQMLSIEDQRKKLVNDYKKKQDILPQIVHNEDFIRTAHLDRFNYLNENVRFGNKRNLMLSLGKYSALGGLIATPFWLYNYDKSRQNDFNTTASAKRFGAVISQASRLSDNDRIKYKYGINPDSIPDEQKHFYYDGLTYNIPKELIGSKIQEELVLDLLNAKSTDGEEKNSYLNKANQLLKSYGYQVKSNNDGQVQFIKQ